MKPGGGVGETLPPGGQFEGNMKHKTDTINKYSLPSEPGSIAWHLERGDKAAALRKLVEVRRWLDDMRVALEKGGER